MKSITHVFKREKLDKDIEHENKLRPETVKECTKFSKLLLELSNKWANISESREAIKNEIAIIKQLELDNQNNLLDYLEYLILDQGQNEFIVPYYSISNEIGHEINTNIAKHENSHFGILGDIHDILNQ